MQEEIRFKNDQIKLFKDKERSFQVQDLKRHHYLLELEDKYKKLQRSYLPKQNPTPARDNRQGLDHQNK